MIKLFFYLIVGLIISLIYYHFLDENKNIDDYEFQANRIRNFGLITLFYPFFILFFIYKKIK
jgi:hypothetical protein